MSRNRYGESTAAQIDLMERLVYDAKQTLSDATNLGIDTATWRDVASVDSLCAWAKIKDTWSMSKADASHAIDYAKRKLDERRARIEAAKQGAHGQTWEAASARIADIIRRSAVADADALVGWLSRVKPA